VWSIGFVTALITGFYTGRMWWMSFWGKPSPERPVEHPHEAPPVMLIPVMVLAVLATLGGLIQTRAVGFGPQAVSDFLASAVGAQAWEGGTADVLVSLVTMVLAGLLFMAAYRFYVERTWKPWSARFPQLQALLERKYYFDEAYNYAFVRPMDAVAEGGLEHVEQTLIDGLVVGTGQATEAGAGSLSLTQSGYFRNYVLVFLAGACIAAILILVRASS
jgi:NADH-quinone oxidoreductase subunit L